MGRDTIWRYNEPIFDEIGQLLGSKGREVTEEQILEQYWLFWLEGMKDRGKDNLISEENCIEDWTTIHWAWRKEDE